MNSELVRPLAESVVRTIMQDLRQRVEELEGLSPRVLRARARYIRKDLDKLQEYAHAHGVLTGKHCARLSRILLTR